MKMPQDPWKVTTALIVLVAVLAFLFPKPERIEEEETNIPDPRTPPPNTTEAVFADPDDVRCIEDGTDKVMEGCRWLGAEGGMAYHLFVRWDLSEFQRRAQPYTVTGARLELRENHEEQYEGPIHVRPMATADGFTAALGAEPVASGGRISTRTLRAPLDAQADAFDALVEDWLNGDTTNNGLVITIVTDPPSSVDEYTPSLTFFYTQ